LNINSFEIRKNQEGNHVFCGGELIFSKVIRVVFPPSISIGLIISLECQEKGGV